MDITINKEAHEMHLLYLQKFEMLSVKKQIVKSMLLTLLIQLSWLISSALGINAFLQQDWLTVSAYLLAGVFGNYINFKVVV